MKKLLILTCALAMSAVVLTAADGDKPAKPKPQTFLTVETAGPDYSAQGEYLNDWGGAQVIALGEDRFRLVTFKDLGVAQGYRQHGESREQSLPSRPRHRLFSDGR